jgi:subtilase family serine protease
VGFEPLENRSLLSTLTPAQMRHAYGMDAISFPGNGQSVQGTGAGQTIAIVVADHNPFISSEVKVFDRTYGLPDPSLIQVNLAGTRSDEGWAQEEALDVEWAHVMAPGASIMVVEAASDSVGDLMTAVNLARQAPGVSVVSMSWGSGEFRGQAANDSFFTTPAGHGGVTFVTASGDSGGRFGAQWPASSSRVVAVGGTSLQVDAQGNILSETAWTYGGGGLSQIVPEPSYQAGVQRSSRRSTPDVSLDADPNTGVAIFVVSPRSGGGYWQVIGGTSLSAQLFAGIVAVADQGRSLRGVGPLDGATQTLPYLYAASANDFHDVTSGSNGLRAARGYDLATGLGSPKAASLAGDLAVGILNPIVPLAPARTRTHAPRRPRVRRAELALESRYNPRAQEAQHAGSLAQRK